MQMGTVPTGAGPLRARYLSGTCREPVGALGHVGPVGPGDGPLYANYLIN